MNQNAFVFIKTTLNTSIRSTFGKKLSLACDTQAGLGPYASLMMIIGLAFIFCLFPMRQAANAQMFLVTTNCQEKSYASEFEYQRVENIASALKLVQPGDTLWIDDGIYTEDIIIYQKGTPENPIIISALPDASPVIDGGFIYFDPNSQYITVKGLEIKNQINASGIRLSFSSSNITIEDCVIHDTGLNGIYLKGRNHTISNNTIYDTGLSDYMYKTHGIYVNAENSIIENNIISGSNSGNGIRSEGINNHIIGNTTFDNKGYGISIFADVPTSDMVIADNTVYNNKIGIAIIGGSAGNRIENVQIINNTIYDNIINMVVMGESRGVHLERNEINSASYIQIYVALNLDSSFTILENASSTSGYYFFNGAVYTDYKNFASDIDNNMLL